MKIFKSTLLAACAGAMTLGLLPVTAQSVAAQAGPTIPVEAWSLRNVMPTVQVSPDGKQLVLLKLFSKEGEYIMELYDTSDLRKEPFRADAKPMEIISASFVDDRYIFGTAWQVKRKSVKRPEADVRDYLAFSFDTQTKKFKKVPGNFNIVNTLPADPEHVIVASGRNESRDTGDDPFAAFRPRNYYKFNLSTGVRSLILKGSEKYPQAVFDFNGEPRFTQSIDRTTNELSYYFRAPGAGSWTEAPIKYDYDDMAEMYRIAGSYGVQGFDPEDPAIVYILDDRGEDKISLYKYDTRTMTFGEKVYGNEEADILGLQRHSIPGREDLVAAIYPGAKYERHWFDDNERQLHENLAKEIPNSHQVSIRSRSRDGGTMVVFNSGPKDPGSWWLVRGDNLVKIGSTNPALPAEQLSDVEFIKYKARDGRTIPAYVTKPRGKGPHPLVVLPHGGPTVNEVIGFDEWGQLLANAGYMVVQPQYRVSTGWGKDHFMSGHDQHGFAMQDDKDDAALHLIEQGLVDPDRVAMFGWSYGGYAALVATSREDNIYQCAVAGAAVSNPKKVYQQRRNPNAPKALDEFEKRRGAVSGIDPMEEIGKTNIPLLMVHGDVDARVRYFNFTDYKKAMDKAGKPAQYLTLKGADHFSNTLMYNHQEVFYTKLLDFLANDCGPDGL